MSSSSIAQHAAVAAFEDRPNIIDKYRLKRNLVSEYLKDSGYEIHGLQGAFYAFVKAPNDLTDLEFVDRASERGVILVPGRAFSRLHGYVRLSYGADPEKLLKGLKVLSGLSNEIRTQNIKSF